MITTEAKRQVTKDLGKHGKDTGSTEVQIGILTKRITDLTGHLKSQPKDEHSRRGLRQMVGKRKKLLAHLREKNFEKHQKVIKKLKIRG